MIPLVLVTGGPMARRTFDVIDICEIFTHWNAGRSRNEIAWSLGLSRNTVRKYLAAAEAAGMVPGGPAVSPRGAVRPGVKAHDSRTIFAPLYLAHPL